MERTARLRYRAVAAAVGVTLVWSPSFILIKFLLPHVGPLTIGGLRYFLACVVLLPFLLLSAGRGRARVPASGRLWLKMLVLGLCAYTIGNGALLLGLRVLPATVVSFLFSFNPVLVLIGSLLWLREIPSRLQFAGLAIAIVGSVVFFSPGLQSGNVAGVVIVCVGLVAFAIFGILGREIARERLVDTLSLTTIPLGLGGGILLLIGIAVEGIPHLSLGDWGLIACLAIVSTAIGYVLYYYALERLTALELNIILDLCPLGTALLAWLFLGEVLGPIRVVGMLIVILGVMLTQMRQPHFGEAQVAHQSEVR